MYEVETVMQRPRARQAGFTLIEVVITAAVLFIGLLAMTSTSWVVHSLRGTYADKQLAHQGLQGVIEDLYALGEIARDDEDGWAPTILERFGPGGDIGETFNVRGLEAWPDEASVGRVTIVTNETLTDEELGVALGMPRDLNGDGAVNDTDVSDDAVLLPVIVELRWRGEAGNRRLRQCVYLLAY
jgi:prepilin-type N-terminal cleavage/methylation domain-containing protein